MLTLRQRAEDHPKRFLSFIFFFKIGGRPVRPQKVKDSLSTPPKEGLKVRSYGWGVVEPDPNRQPCLKKRPKEGRDSGAAGLQPTQEESSGQQESTRQNWRRTRSGSAQHRPRSLGHWRKGKRRRDGCHRRF